MGSPRVTGSEDNSVFGAARFGDSRDMSLSPTLSQTRQSLDSMSTWKSTRKLVPSSRKRSFSDGLSTLLNSVIPRRSIDHSPGTDTNFDKPLPIFTEKYGTFVTKEKSPKTRKPLPTIEREHFALASMKRSFSSIAGKTTAINTNKPLPQTLGTELLPNILSVNASANTGKPLPRLVPTIPLVKSVSKGSSYYTSNRETVMKGKFKPSDAPIYFEKSAMPGRHAIQEMTGIPKSLESLTSRVGLQHKAKKSRIPVLIVRLPEIVEPSKRLSNGSFPLNSAGEKLKLSQRSWSSEKRTPLTAGTLIDPEVLQVGAEPSSSNTHATSMESSAVVRGNQSSLANEERRRKKIANRLPEHRESLLVAVSQPLTSKPRRPQMEKMTDCRMLAPVAAEPKRRSSLSFVQSSENSEFGNIDYQHEVFDDKSSVFDLLIPDSFVRPMSPPLYASMSKNSKGTARSEAGFWDDIFESVDADDTDNTGGEQDEEVATLRESPVEEGEVVPPSFSFPLTLIAISGAVVSVISQMEDQLTFDQMRQICTLQPL
ncbi:hypothetical protein HDU82_001368 [Entophlyctis luteolus]|nr:hypothetical protein HDU82_001368 [Entophlyctis luteolus]